METEAQAAAQRNRAPNGYHRGCAHWVIEPGVLEPHAPEAARLELMNLRAFAAAPDRLEHFLEPVARIDDCILENATASEPLFFGHVNVSDEFNFLMRTGDVLMDHGRGRTFFFHPETGALIGYTLAGAGDVVLHPQGLVHWPGQLKDPFTPVPQGDERRKLFTIVYCSYTRQRDNESARPPERRVVQWPQAQGPFLPQFEGYPLQQGVVKVNTHAERFGVTSVLALGAAVDRKSHALTTLGRVANTQVDFFTAEGPRGAPFGNPDGLYLICYEGAARVEITDGTRSVATLRARTADMIKIPAGWDFETHVEEGYPARSLFLVFRRSPRAGAAA
ncbi:MAG: hypothetical protein KC466_08025 [Myxococcales bacterium]|nr:hypothetical protein [Myxococcales bacterium]